MSTGCDEIQNSAQKRSQIGKTSATTGSVSPNAPEIHVDVFPREATKLATETVYEVIYAGITSWHLRWFNYP